MTDFKHAVAVTLTQGDTWCGLPVTMVKQDNLTNSWSNTTCAECQRVSPYAKSGWVHGWSASIEPPERAVDDPESSSW